jgi:hypothetical protein
MLEEAECLAKRWKRSRAQAEERRTRAQDFAGKLAWDLGYVFRNIYKSPLAPAKVEFANQAAQGLVSDFKPYHQ